MIRAPKASQRLRNCSLFSFETKTVPIFSPCKIRAMAYFSSPRAIARWIPELVAALAAWILVNIPPVPKLLPTPPALASISGVISLTILTSFASGCVCGFAVYNPSTSERITTRSASTMPATRADILSLSPIFNSSKATTSFSLTIGITLFFSSSIKVLREFV